VPGGLDAIVATIDREFRHQHFQTEPIDSGISLSFQMEKRFFRVRVTKEYDQDYGSVSVKKLDHKLFADALRNAPNGNLTVTRTGFVNG
jgi:hypothetical protein